MFGWWRRQISFYNQSKEKNTKIILDGKLMKLMLQNTKRFVPPSCSKWDLAWWDCRWTTTDALDTINWKRLQIATALSPMCSLLRLTVTVTQWLIPGYVLFTLRRFWLHSATRAHFAHRSSCVVSAVPLSVFSAQVCRAHRLCAPAACLCCIPSSQTSGLGDATDTLWTKTPELEVNW